MWLIRDLHRKIVNVVQEIEKCEDKWLTLIKNSLKQDKDAEEKIFEEIVADPGNFLVTKALAKEQESLLQSYGHLVS